MISALGSGAIQPLNNLLFGTLTDVVIEFAQKCYNFSAETCDQTAKDDLLNGISHFSLWCTVIGVGIFVSNYIGTECFSYAAIKQVSVQILRLGYAVKRDRMTGESIGTVELDKERMKGRMDLSATKKLVEKRYRRSQKGVV